MKNLKGILVIVFLLVIAVSSIGINTLRNQQSIELNETTSTSPTSLNRKIVNTPSPQEILATSPPPSRLPTVAGVYGNLTQYNLILNCSLPEKLDSAPILVQYNVTTTETQAKEIARESFGLHNTTRDNTIGYPSAIMLWSADGEKKHVNVCGLNTILYSGSLINSMFQGSSINSTNDIANWLLTQLDKYWNFDTDAVRELTYVGPFGYTETYSFNGTLLSTSIDSYGVSYRYSVQGIPLVGNGADCWVEGSNDNIKNAELHFPVIKIAGQQEVTVSPSQALDNFLNGNGIPGRFVPMAMVPEHPTNGNCTINRVRLVYYINWSFDRLYDRYPTLVYEIKGILQYIDSSGKIMIEPFTTYEYAID